MSKRSAAIQAIQQAQESLLAAQQRANEAGVSIASLVRDIRGALVLLASAMEQSHQNPMLDDVIEDFALQVGDSVHDAVSLEIADEVASAAYCPIADALAEQRRENSRGEA